MPLEDMSRIALQAAQWLEATFDILPQPTRLALFRRLWDASQIAADPADEWDFDMTLNHAGGVLGHVLYKEMSEEIPRVRSEEHTSELQSLMRISYAVFCLKKK